MRFELTDGPRSFRSDALTTEIPQEALWLACRV